VSALHADYVRAIDDDRLEAWPEFFHEQCLYSITTVDNHREGLEAGIVWADSRAMLKDRVLSLREANIYERHRYRHLIGAPAIVSDDASGVRAESSFLVVRINRDGTMDLFATGRYLDVVRTDPGDGRLKLAERIVVCDSARIDTLLAIPL
jgi:3-phenylpropionate/cinnamic acid dioxygenase small subunit